MIHPVQRSTPPALIAESRDAQKAWAQRRAFDSCNALGCAANTFAEFHPQAHNNVLFTCSRGNEKILLKAQIGDAPTIAEWPEPLLASLASRSQLQLPTYPTRVPGVVARHFVEGEPLKASELRKVDLEVVAMLHDLHESTPSFWAQVAPHGDRSELFVGALDALKQPQIQNLLGESASANVRERLNWLDDRLKPLSFERKFIHGDIRSGHVIREDGALRILDWGTARFDDPLFDLVRMSSSLQTRNKRLLSCLGHYAACSGRKATAQEEQRILLQQAANNVREFLISLQDTGLHGYRTRTMVTRLLDDEEYLIDMPKVALTEGPLSDVERLGAARNIEEARELANFFVTTQLPPGMELTEPLPQHKNHFAYFRASKEDQDWFVKVSFNAPVDSRWAEPAWMSWAADEGFGPQVHPSSGDGRFANVLASQWLPGQHLDRDTANLPQVRRAVLAQMRRLHQTAAPSDLIPAAPEQEPSYAGRVWTGLDALELAGVQEPLSSPYLRQLLSKVVKELSENSVRQTVCHRDTHPRNVFFNDGKAVFVDWDWAGWDDPIRDPARYFVLGYTPLEDLPGGFADYLGHVASPAEMRHLQLIMLAIEIEFYCLNQVDTYPEHRSVTERAERIEQFVGLLGLN